MIARESLVEMLQKGIHNEDSWWKIEMLIETYW